MSAITWFRVRIARTAEEERLYYGLRERIFCAEQRLFPGTDRDARDTRALPIVCVARGPQAAEQVIGVVRIYEDEPGIWYGGRLGVAEAHRGMFALHRALVACAVQTAAALGAQRFVAHVQAGKVPLMERLHFRVQHALSLHGRPHAQMEADLAHYARGESSPLVEYAREAG